MTSTLIARCGLSPHPAGHVVNLRSLTNFKIIISLGGFEQAVNLVDKKSKKVTGTWDYWKILSSCGFLQAQSSYLDNQSVCRLPNS